MPAVKVIRIYPHALRVFGQQNGEIIWITSFIVDQRRIMRAASELSAFANNAMHEVLSKAATGKISQDCFLLIKSVLLED